MQWKSTFKYATFWIILYNFNHLFHWEWSTWQYLYWVNAFGRNICVQNCNAWKDFQLLWLLSIQKKQCSSSFFLLLIYSLRAGTHHVCFWVGISHLESRTPFLLLTLTFYRMITFYWMIVKEKLAILSIQIRKLSSTSLIIFQ